MMSRGEFHFQQNSKLYAFKGIYTLKYCRSEKNIGGTILEHHFLTWVQCVKNELKVFKLLIDLYNLTS